MQPVLDNEVLRNPNFRRWFMLGLVALPLLLSASGLRSYYMSEAFMYLKPATWSDIERHIVKEDWCPAFYRPMARIIPALYLRLFGANPIVPRAIQLVTYAATCLLAFLILEALSQSFRVAAAGSLIFAVMPSHVESLFQLIQLITLNAVFCSLLILWLLGPGYDRRPQKAKIIISCLAYVFGLLSYPNVLLTPVFLLFYEALWGTRLGFAAVKRRVLSRHLPLWVITGLFLMLRVYQLSQIGDQADWYLDAATGLTVLTLVKRMVPVFYAMICPLQLSPTLVLVAIALLYSGVRKNLRFTIFLVLYTLIAPIMSYPQTDILSRRVYLASFGVAGLIGFLLVSCLESLLDMKRRSRLVSLLDWVFVVSIWYWVFELLRIGWADFFCQEPLAHHFRFYASIVAGASLVARWIVSRSRRPLLSRVPLTGLSVGLFGLILAFYGVAFLRVLDISKAECAEVAEIPRAIVRAQPEMPDNSMILLVMDEDVPVPEEMAQSCNIRGPLRAEYGKDLGLLGFKTWAQKAQYKTVPPDVTLVALRLAGNKIALDQELTARILARQRSYSELSADRVHLSKVVDEASAEPMQHDLGVDSMLVDRVDFTFRGELLPTTARVEFFHKGRPVILEVPILVQGTSAVVRLDREPKWLLAGKLGPVRTSLLALDQDHAARSVPVKEAVFVQTKGLIGETHLVPLPEWPWMSMRPIDTPLAKVRIILTMNDLQRCIALP